MRAFLDPSKSLGCRYGALVGLESLGPQVTRMVILPNVKAFGEEMQGIVKKEESVNGDGASTAISRAADEAKLCLSSVEVRHIHILV